MARFQTILASKPSRAVLFFFPIIISFLFLFLLLVLFLCLFLCLFLFLFLLGTGIVRVSDLLQP